MSCFSSNISWLTNVKVVENNLLFFNHYFKSVQCIFALMRFDILTFGTWIQSDIKIKSYELPFGFLIYSWNNKQCKYVQILTAYWEYKYYCSWNLFRITKFSQIRKPTLTYWKLRRERVDLLRYILCYIIIYEEKNILTIANIWWGRRSTSNNRTIIYICN